MTPSPASGYTLPTTLPMPKLVCLTAGFNDRVFEVKPEKATIGRLDDNSFPIPEPSVSSHHCEISAKGDDIVVKDLADLMKPS